MPKDIFLLLWVRFVIRSTTSCTFSRSSCAVSRKPTPTEWKCLKLKGSTISSPKNIIRTRTLIKKESKNILGIYVFMVLLSVVRLPLDFILVSILIIKRSFFSIWETNVRLSNFFESILSSDSFIFIRVKLKS